RRGHVAGLIERRPPQRREREIAAAIYFRIILFQPLRNCVELSVRLLTRHPGFEERVAFYPTLAAIFQFVAGRVERLLHRRWHPKTKIISDERAVKSFRGDPDDRVLNAVQHLSSADDVRVAFVTIFPRLIADHGHWMCVATFAFLRSEAAAENWSHAERVEIICRHNCTRRAFSAITHTQRRARDPVDDERLEERGVLFVIEKLGVGKSGESILAAGGRVQREHAILMSDQRIWANQNSFDPT